MPRRIELKNPNRFTVPVTLKRDGQLVQVNIAPRTSIQIDRKELTSAVENIAHSKNNLLVMKRV